MNKQEVIEEIRIRAKYDSEYRTSLIRSDKAIELIKKIDESESRQLDEPKKLILPKCAEQWIEGHCAPSDVVNLFIEVTCATDSDGFIDSKWRWSTDFYEWLANDADTLYILCDALRYGYEVEKEPKWKIINDDKYCLTSIEAGYGNSLHWAFDSTKKKPILFDNEETAMYTAYITGGTVVKAWV